jgi:hypothetical protein
MNFVLTAEQVERINRTVRWFETNVENISTNAPVLDGPPIWTYIAKAREDITALDDDIAGSGTAKLCKINPHYGATGPTAGKLVETGLTGINVFNLSDSPVADDSYFGLKRDPISGQYFIDAYGGDVRVVKFTTTDDHSTYPERAEYPDETCTRYPFQTLESASFDDTDVCHEAITEGSPGDEDVAFNLSDNYIPDGTIGIVWKYNNLFWTLGAAFAGSSNTVVGKAGTDGTYPVEGAACRRFPFYIMDDYTFDNSDTCDTTPTEGNEGDEVVALNLGTEYCPEDTICLLHWFNDRWYFEYGQGVGGGGELGWGLVQSGFTNVSPASSKTRVVVKECDIDGSGVTGPTFPVWVGEKSNKATSLFYNDVVGYIEDGDDNKVVVTDAYDDWFHTVKIWSNGATGATAPSTPPNGWYLADGTDGTVDLSAKFVMGYDAGSWALGVTGGYEWHGKGGGTGPAGNNHPDHEPHDHPLIVDDYLYAATGPTGPNTTRFTAIDECATDTEDHPLEHLGPFNSDEDTDNKPPFLVMAFIERID